MRDNIDNNDSGVYVGMLRLFVVLCADDAMIFAFTRQGFQDELDCLSKYCEEFKMRINPSKSKIILVNATKLDN